MAAPTEMTTLDITGKFIMVLLSLRGSVRLSVNLPTQNKSLSDDSDEILRLQGVSWFTRKIIASSSVYLEIKHYKDDEGVEHIDIKQVATPGGITTEELRTLDWSVRPHDDRVFGKVGEYCTSFGEYY